MCFATPRIHAFPLYRVFTTAPLAQADNGMPARGVADRAYRPDGCVVERRRAQLRHTPPS
ncbi:hypothetical protein ACS15_4860 [Ralstonia insidiosa]|uniref:Uncharacterized protein n=1 Tax=Ralstonia insidiosa TaxID=190721 RepID=A0AAC9BJS0_9RALS|nr:hypothetical protein ACS15_4860 [Ralstonia insidiosa]